MEQVQRRRGYYSLGALGYQACRLAYGRGEEWLSQLLIYLDKNRKLVEEFLAEELPQISAAPLEATYLQWLDFRNLGLEPGNFPKFPVEKAQFPLDGGQILAPEEKDSGV